MYAIVDIETTGGYASGNDVTEVAILVYDGNSIIRRFESLVRPTAPIPHYIQVLTGITHEMVAGAPTFAELAEEIFELLNGKVFIAHNVNFDYSFLKHHLGLAGYELNTKKLCTVRLARKVFPGLPSYSLGNLCRSLEIPLEHRHRAGGDAEATVRLFTRLLENGGLSHIEKFLKKTSKEQCLPIHLDREQIQKLPFGPGVYYFHNEKGKVIYVGKAKNLKYRVSSHFTHNGPGKQRQEFLRNIYNISYQECGSELMALILESIEIRRLWPEYNRSQKQVVSSFAIYSYTDQSGYTRLIIEKQKKHLQPLYTFNVITEGHRVLRQLVDRFNLCSRLCFLSEVSCAEGGRSCPACDLKEIPEEYNSRVEEALEYLRNALPSFAVVDPVSGGEQGCILMEKGRFYGMGNLPADVSVHSMEDLKTYLVKYPENDYIRGLVYQYVHQKPEKKILFETP